MADLLTHAAIAHLAARPAGARERVLVIAGATLPDLLYKGFFFFTGSPTWYCEPTHSPLALPVFCGLIALLFEPPLRRKAFACLLVGAWLHVLVDLGKSYMGHGVILWAFPFSMDRVELGWYSTYADLWLMGASAGLIVLTELGARLFRRAPPASRPAG